MKSVTDKIDYTDLFCKARYYLMESVREKVDVFMTGMWDPFIKYMIIRETNDILDKEITIAFPDLPLKYFPKCKFRIFEEELHIEIGIQNYINMEPNLIFLGTNDVGAIVYDYYMRDSWDPRFKYMFIARFGHDRNSTYVGSKTAEAEYYMGAMTPLSVAYGMAIEDGFIS